MGKIGVQMFNGTFFLKRTKFIQVKSNKGNIIR